MLQNRNSRGRGRVLDPGVDFGGFVFLGVGGRNVDRFGWFGGVGFGNGIIFLL